MADKNMFGGGNANSMYIPMSDLEQEALQRLLDQQDLRIVIKDWGYTDNFSYRLGDKRLHIHFLWTFTAPEQPMEVPFLTMELRRHNGQLIFSEVKPTMAGQYKLIAQKGVQIQLFWDIQIESLDPAFVKSILPGTVGLTSRIGNTKYTEEQARIAQQIYAAQKANQTLDATRVQRALKKVRR